MRALTPAAGSGGVSVGQEDGCEHGEVLLAESSERDNTRGCETKTLEQGGGLRVQQQQYVGIDLHRRRSVIVRMNDAGEVLGVVQDRQRSRGAGDGDRRGGPGPGGGAGSAVTAGIGRPTCSRRRGPGASGPSARVCTGTAGESKTTSRTPPSWPTGCAAMTCPRRGSPRRRCASCESWSGTGPSWWRCGPRPRRRSTR